MGWKLGWCYSHGGIDSQGGGSALVPAGLRLPGAASVDGVGEKRKRKGDVSPKEVMDWGGHKVNIPIQLHDVSPHTTQPTPITREWLASDTAFAADVYDITETKTPYDDSIRGHRIEEAVLFKHRNYVALPSL